MNKDEAIQVIRSNYPTGRNQICEALETLIPELKESEDERIRKALIHYFNEQDGILTAIDGSVSVGNILAWLEKQDPNRLEKEIELAYKTADEVQYRKGFEDGVASVKTAEWSEDDEKMCKNLLECLRYGWRKLPTDVSKYESWLKSLRPHPKQEWSEEDEGWMKSTFDKLSIEGDMCLGEKCWIQSLKQRMKGE